MNKEFPISPFWSPPGVRSASHVCLSFAKMIRRPVRRRSEPGNPFGTKHSHVDDLSPKHGGPYIHRSLNRLFNTMSLDFLDFLWMFSRGSSIECAHRYNFDRCSVDVRSMFVPMNVRYAIDRCSIGLGVNRCSTDVGEMLDRCSQQ